MTWLYPRAVLLNHCSRDHKISQKKTKYKFKIFKFFFMLALLVEYIFLTTFYGLYFNHQFTHYIIQFLQVLTCSWWPSVGSFHVLHLHLSFWLMCLCSKFEFKLWNNTLSLTRIWTLINRSEYQANARPTELSWLGFLKIRSFGSILVAGASRTLRVWETQP